LIRNGFIADARAGIDYNDFCVRDALLESVMRAVSDAFVDCGQSGVTQDKRIPARTRIARRATGQDDLAMLKGKTKFKIIVSFPARLDRVHTCTAVIRISGLSRRQRKDHAR